MVVSALLSVDKAGRGRVQLLSFLLVAFSPFLLAWGLWLGDWVPKQHTVRGGLLDHPLTAEQWWSPPSTMDSSSESMVWPASGHWLMVEVLPDVCDRDCRSQLEQLTRLHMALGKNASRVRRVWLGADSFASESTDPYLELISQYQISVPEGVQRFIVDPNGNLILVYRRDQPLQMILKDLRHLLRASSIG